MKAKIKSLMFNHSSFLLIVMGAMSDFLLILFFKKCFSEGFVTFSLYLTFIGIIATFGYFGIDQVFLRLSKVKEAKVFINRDILLLLLLFLVISPLLIGIYFSEKFSGLNFYLLLITGISINLIMLTYNSFRLIKKYSFSQIFKSGYKLFFLTLILLFLILEKISLDVVLLITTAILVLFALFASFFLNKIIIKKEKKTPDIINYSLSFFLNISIITALGYGERIVIINEISEEVFSKYFYFITIFLFPLTLLQQYIGFKELPVFKDGFKKEELFKKIRNVFFLGILTALFIIIVVFIDNGRFLEVDLFDELNLIGLIIFLGIVKLIYGLFSALLGALSSYNDLYIINLATFVIMLFSVYFIGFINVTITMIIIFLITIYLFRCLYIFMRYAK